jgi:hypothetical protein
VTRRFAPRALIRSPLLAVCEAYHFSEKTARGLVAGLIEERWLARIEPADPLAPAVTLGPRLLSSPEDVREQQQP